MEFLRILGYMLLQASCVLLLLNLLVGIIEPIPDILPIIGNLDEIGEVYLIWWSWPRLLKAIDEFREPEPVDDDKHVDNVEYIDVNAEVVGADGSPVKPKEENVESNA